MIDNNDLPPRLQALDEKLSARDVMMLSTLDGYVAGIILCSEMIPPSEWLPEIFQQDEDEDEDEDEFDAEAAAGDLETIQALTGPILEHYNAVIADLEDAAYAPIFDVDLRHNDILWQLWAEGFLQAIALRAESWEALLNSDDEEDVYAFSTLMALAGITKGEAPLGEDQKHIEEKLAAEAPDLIPICVQHLYDTRRKTAAAPLVNKGPKTGRNDPCPCGSGKKYKKCCGAAA